MSKFFEKKNLVAFLFSLLGTCFLIYYIFRASLNVVASDYIRLINYYLPDTSDLHFLLSWEGISRIPFTFLARFINKEYFHYNVYFDKILGVFGLFLFNFMTVRYALSTYKSLFAKIVSSIAITFMSFSLISWEMILNGTGYAHFITTGLIAVIFYLYSKTSIEVFLYIVIIITSICFAGQYAVGFLSTIIFFSFISIIILVKDYFGKKDFTRLVCKHITFIIISIICIFCFLKSNSTGEALVPVGMKDVSLIEVITTDITFPIRFLFKSLASAVIGTETFSFAITTGTINDLMIYFIGATYLLIIIFTIIVFYNLTKKNQGTITSFVFPLMYIVLGLGNFLLVFLARYKFLDDTYGMSSRYGIQYMFLTIGVILILFRGIDTFVVNKQKNRRIVLVISSLSIIFLLTGHITTTIDEVFKADYRKIAYINLVGVARCFRDYSDEDLTKFFEYKRGADQIRSAMKILEENKLNVFEELR